ncbi:unnamed protein product, partial [Amoebophrya sp. A25]|eukprot:GSA25T00006788001.1
MLTHTSTSCTANPVMSHPGTALPMMTNASTFPVIKNLGRGAFGQVDLISSGKRQYALKQYHFEDLQSAKHRDLALEEGRVLQRISHPNIVRCYWVQVTKYTIYLLLQYIDGGDLHHFIAQRREKRDQHLFHPSISGIYNSGETLPSARGGSASASSSSASTYKEDQGQFNARTIFMWFRQLLEALAHIHSLSILHRDIKPSNILLSSDLQRVYLADFGVCRVLRRKGGMACTNVGSPVYAAPEVWSGKSYTNKVDIFSLGCCMYEVSTLKAPFDG